MFARIFRALIRSKRGTYRAYVRDNKKGRGSDICLPLVDSCVGGTSVEFRLLDLVCSWLGGVQRPVIYMSSDSMTRFIPASNFMTGIFGHHCDIGGVTSDFHFGPLTECQVCTFLTVLIDYLYHGGLRQEGRF